MLFKTMYPLENSQTLYKLNKGPMIPAIKESKRKDLMEKLIKKSK